jgi:hypothetical protein
MTYRESLRFFPAFFPVASPEIPGSPRKSTLERRARIVSQLVDLLRNPLSRQYFGGPARNVSKTLDQIRKPPLYPAELRGHKDLRNNLHSFFTAETFSFCAYVSFTQASIPLSRDD